MRCVPALDFNVAKAIAWRSAIHDDPPYQREGSVWTLDKQQLFIDSLLNGYDVPKIYLHDLRGRHPTQVYAVVDGRQRLTTMWRFLADEFPLADDFRIEPANRPELPDGTTDPMHGMRFSQLDRAWQRVLRSTHLAVVLITNATEEDIDDLFSRLNNGEPLNAAEKRNAIGGAVAELVREVVDRPFFTDRVHFSSARYGHHDAATRLLLVEHADPTGDGAVPDLGVRALDAFVRANRNLGSRSRTALRGRVALGLDRLEAIFTSADQLLARQSAVPLYHLFLRELAREAPDELPTARTFLEGFEHTRRTELRRSDGRTDPALAEFTRLMQHGTYEARSWNGGWRSSARRTRNSAGSSFGARDRQTVGIASLSGSGAASAPTSEARASRAPLWARPRRAHCSAIAAGGS